MDHTVWGLAPILARQEFCHLQLDPEQLAARLRHHACTNHMDFCEFCASSARVGNLQLVRLSFVNLQLARTTLVNLYLVFHDSTVPLTS